MTVTNHNSPGGAAGKALTIIVTLVVIAAIDALV